MHCSLIKLQTRSHTKCVDALQAVYHVGNCRKHIYLVRMKCWLHQRVREYPTTRAPKIFKQQQKHQKYIWKIPNHRRYTAKRWWIPGSPVERGRLFLNQSLVTHWNWTHFRFWSLSLPLCFEFWILDWISLREKGSRLFESRRVAGRSALDRARRSLPPPAAREVRLAEQRKQLQVGPAQSKN